jgi:hypothetical protein
MALGFIVFGPTKDFGSQSFQRQAPERIHRDLGILAEMRALFASVLDVAMNETNAMTD